MVANTSKHKKTYSSKTAVITIETPDGGERVVEATHYIRSDDGTVSIYQGARSDGIDWQVHISRCVIRRVNELPSHSEAFSGMFDDVDEIETDDDDQENGDGGNAREEFEDVDYVRYGGEAYRLSHVADADTLVLDQVHENSIDAPADECTPADVRGNPLDQEADDDDEPKLVTDGGQTIETGDYVEHAGERHRVARVGESHCEIYQLGSVSEIVPISDVIAVPEVPA